MGGAGYQLFWCVHNYGVEIRLFVRVCQRDSCIFEYLRLWLLFRWHISHWTEQGLEANNSMDKFIVEWLLGHSNEQRWQPQILPSPLCLPLQDQLLYTSTGPNGISSCKYIIAQYSIYTIYSVLLFLCVPSSDTSDGSWIAICCAPSPLWSS